MYYLQSRYYNPEWGRFINADALISTGQGLLAHNMFAYCNNNPVNLCDPTGEIAITTCILIVSIVAGGLVAGHTAAVSNKRTGKVDIYNTITAGLSSFLLFYTLGMSAYQMYEAYCYCNGIEPVTNVGESPAPVTTKGSPNAVGKAGERVRITGYTKHGLQQAMGRDNAGVKPSAIIDAVRNPVDVVLKIDELGRVAHVFHGNGATVILNSAGKVITTWASSSQYWRMSIK